jgi:hypothetical protein
MPLSFSEPVRVNTVYVLSEQKWMPLAALSNVGHDSREYTEVAPEFSTRRAGFSPICSC